MDLPAFWAVVAGGLATLGGLAALRGGLRRASPRLRASAIAAGTALVAAGPVTAVVGLGWDVGLPVWLGLAALGGIAVTVATARVGTATNPGRRRVEPRSAGRPVRKLAILAAFVMAAAGSVAMLFALALWLPLPPADRALVAVVLWPMLWAGIVLYLFAASRRRLAYGGVVVLTGLAGLSAAYGFLG